MGYSGFSTSDCLEPRYPSPAPSEFSVSPPDFVITPPSKPFFPGPGPTDKLETIEEARKRLKLAPPEPELDYIPGRDTFDIFKAMPLVENIEPTTRNRYLPGVHGRRLAETTGVLVISVTDEDGKPVPSGVTIDYHGSPESYEAIGEAISIPLDPLKLGLATIKVVPPDGYVTPEAVSLTLNPGTQEVKIVVAKSMVEIYVAAAVVGTLAFIGLGFVIL